MLLPITKWGFAPSVSKCSLPLSLFTRIGVKNYFLNNYEKSLSEHP